ncbi:hypothetical protein YASMINEVIRUS_741 [Yasminevirus sp. GU-2018]|uniref:Uncharacterized protein n=1 Tax=Yasminevirus sp. GU-2018 TaxID=2420051 RepID=A0A5K0U8B6_9VIRU|nr:hypothetical protein YASMINEVIRUS_741 [Yasminevirus sp. GU-2018]
MEEFLSCSNDADNIVTPESLAWKILMDDDVEDYAGVMLPFVTSDQDQTGQNAQNTNMRYDSLADQFQILITVYMEMVFGMLKINHVSSNLNSDGDVNEGVDLEKTFKPDLSQFTVEHMLEMFREKFKKIRVFLSVREIFDAKEDNPRDFGSSKDYYCRVILKDTPDGKTHFWANRHTLDPEKRYTFVIRQDEKKTQKKLDDFYAVVALPNFKARISFSPINIIVKNQHAGF